MTLNFTKMQGAGNDYIYIDALREESPVRNITNDELSKLAIRLSSRHFGVGADGLVLILPSSVANARMRIFNADGSEAEMCGNATRCIGLYLHRYHYPTAEELSLETRDGIKYIHIEDDGLITVYMGQEIGNPHAVNFVDQITDDMVLVDGPRIEHDPKYPNRTNVEFVQVLDRHSVRMRVWERGSGETLACGTGACAVAQEAIRQGLCESPISVHLPGGDLTIAIHEDGRIFMTGPAEIVFSGQIEI